MKYRSLAIYSLGALVLLLAATGRATANDGNLIVNGDFEASGDPYFPDLPTFQWDFYFGTNGFGWTVAAAVPGLEVFVVRVIETTRPVS